MERAKQTSGSTWFSEVSTVCPGQSFSIEIEELLEKKKSDYQDILVFQSRTYGRVLVLDGMIQLTERDEFAYQEMLTHIPMFSHPNPQKVLIVGGGDGGILREVLKHPNVEKVVQCEIDEEVINLSKKFFPTLSKSYSDPKLELHIGNGFEYLKNNRNQFDVIITDSSDPIGPGECLFQTAYFGLMKEALRHGGLLASQGECVWLHLDFIKSLISDCRNIFPVVDYAYASVPSYPSGQIGFLLCSTDKATYFRTPLRQISEDDSDKWNLRYYYPAIHSAAFILPRFGLKAFSASSVT